MRRTIVVVAIVAMVSGSHSGTAPSDVLPAWPTAGRDFSNTRHQPWESIIGRSNVARLAPLWVFTAEGEISATPAVVGKAVYVPDWAGNLLKIDAATGQPIWMRTFAEYTGIPGAKSRATPAVAGSTLVVGTQLGAHLLGIDTRTGDLRWRTQLDAHHAAVITQSPVISGSRVYVGVSSREELLAVNPRYVCCTFRGSVAAVDLASGAIAWQTYMTPPNQGLPGGYSGNAVWGSTPVVDTKRNSVYITTGSAGLA